MRTQVAQAFLGQHEVLDQILMALLAALAGEARVLALAERCALPPARVRHALAPRELHKPDQFFQSVSTLAQMRLRV